MATKKRSKSPSTSTVVSSDTPRKGRRSKEHVFDDEKESLAFKVLSADQTKELEDIGNVELLQDKIMEIVQVTDHLTDLKAGAMLDYYVAGVWWAKEQQFTSEQISAFYSVIHTLLLNLQEKNMTLLENLKEFKKMLVGIGQENCETSGGLECFNIKQAKDISDYVHASFFQHHKLFEFITSHTQAEEIIGTDLEIEVPLAADTPWPPPLVEGVPQETFDEFIAPPPPQEEPEPKTEEELAEERRKAEEEAAAKAKEEESKVQDLLSQLSTEEVKTIMNQVFDEMLGGVKSDIAHTLREKENALITRINKVHKIEK